MDWGDILAGGVLGAAGAIVYNNREKKKFKSKSELLIERERIDQEIAAMDEEEVVDAEPATESS